MATRTDLGPVSAYAIAVANGFVGTEEEWINYLVNAGKAGGYADSAQYYAVEAAEAYSRAEAAAERAENYGISVVGTTLVINTGAGGDDSNGGD